LQLDRIKRAVLSEADWNCARKRAEFARIGTNSMDNGSFGEWRYAYRVPPDCLTVRRFVGQVYFGRNAKFSRELDAEHKPILFTNHGPSAFVVYTVDMLDVNRWSPTLVDACATRLSVEFATAIARDVKLADAQIVKYMKKIELATGIDEAEGGIESMRDADLVNVRFRDTGWR
jgi:hypothetical protein